MRKQERAEERAREKQSECEFGGSILNRICAHSTPIAVHIIFAVVGALRLNSMEKSNDCKQRTPKRQPKTRNEVNCVCTSVRIAIMRTSETKDRIKNSNNTYTDTHTHTHQMAWRECRRAFTKHATHSTARMRLYIY